MGAFGELDLDDLDTSFTKGTYRLKLADVQDRDAKVEDGEPKRKFIIFNFEISDTNPDVEDFNGERTKGVFLNYWPNLNEEIYKSMSGQDKGNVRRSLKLYKTLGRAFGASEKDIKAGNVDWEEYMDTYVYATLYADKNGEPAIQTDSFANEASVEI